MGQESSSGRIQRARTDSTWSDAMISLLLVDDHAVVREGYRRLLEGDPDITVVAEAASSSQALRMERELTPDVIVLDIALPDVSCIESLHRILARRPAA